MNTPHKKPRFSTEAAYLVGLFFLAFGTALMERADFGVSMVVAPAYLLYRKLHTPLPFFTFGMAEYLFQLMLILLLSLVLRRFRPRYLFSFATAVLYGFMLDGCMALIPLFPDSGFPVRCLLYALGVPACSLGVSLLFKPYIPPEAYELFVQELSRKLGAPIPRVKIAYDCTSFLLSVLLSFAFFGFGVFEGIKGGSALCTFVNGPLIGLFTRLLDSRFAFFDRFSLRSRFQ